MLTSTALVVEFTDNAFSGRGGYGVNEGLFIWTGERVSDEFEEDCVRYKLVHDSDKLPDINVNGIELKQGESSDYIFPEKCEDVVNLDIKISDKTINKQVPVDFARSYYFYIQGNPEDIEIKKVEMPADLVREGIL